MTAPSGTPLPHDQAWLRFDQWKNAGAEIGVQLQAWFRNGDWLALAERLRPESLP